MEYKSKSEADMAQIGQNIIEGLNLPTLIELIGDLGAGKTTLTKGFARALQISDHITSPSFTISNIYSGPKFNLVHYDFYRLADPGIMQDELAETILDPKNLVVIEWGESLSAVLPANRIKIYITKNDDDSRSIRIEKGNPGCPGELR